MAPRATRFQKQVENSNEIVFFLPVVSLKFKFLYIFFMSFLDENLGFSHLYQVLLYQGTDEGQSQFANQDSILLTEIKRREEERN
jgi:hypothetical protein